MILSIIHIATVLNRSAAAINRRRGWHLRWRWWRDSVAFIFNRNRTQYLHRITIVAFIFFQRITITIVDKCRTSRWRWFISVISAIACTVVCWRRHFVAIVWIVSVIVSIVVFVSKINAWWRTNNFRQRCIVNDATISIRHWRWNCDRCRWISMIVYVIWVQRSVGSWFGQIVPSVWIIVIMIGICWCSWHVAIINVQRSLIVSGIIWIVKSVVVSIAAKREKVIYVPSAN